MPPLPPMLLELPPQPLVRRTDLARRRGFDFNFGTMDLSVRTTGQTGSNTCWPSLEVPVFLMWRRRQAPAAARLPLLFIMAPVRGRWA